MLKEGLVSVIVRHPIETGKTVIALAKEVIEFEPRPGSDKGYEPRLDLRTVIERTSERIEARKAG